MGIKFGHSKYFQSINIINYNQLIEEQNNKN